MVVKMKIKLSGMVPDSAVDGPGLRLAVFFQGCPHRCEGCHNPETWDKNCGYWADTDEIIERLSENPLCRGITLTGGEPFCQPEQLILLAKETKKLGMDVVCFTGYTFEQLTEGKKKEKEALEYIDILVDGPFEKELRTFDLPFRGSKNQRMIDVGALRPTRRN
jgi:anaerobic ribonucleoside-triphosphate reductase activating protein